MRRSTQIMRDVTCDILEYAIERKTIYASLDEELFDRVS